MTQRQKNEQNRQQRQDHLRQEIREIDAAQTAGKPLDLPQQGSWPAAPYLLEQQASDGLIAALAAGKPLLVRGEPGVGKSQLARAAAEVLERPFIADVVQPDSEYTDLLWRIDFTRRLADAQMAGRPVTADETKTGATPRDVDDIRHYIGPGPIWWALNAKDASDQHTRGSANFLPDPMPDPKQCRERGAVLLLDEVDKADISLTNGLLEVLGNGGFTLPALGHSVRCEGPPPLVVLTSNDTRELPPALLRRCVVLTLKLDDDLVAHLMRIGAIVFPHFATWRVGKDKRSLLEEAAHQILQDRNRCSDAPRTGLAEYLDLLRALDEASADAQQAERWLVRLGGYFHKSQVTSG